MVKKKAKRLITLLLILTVIISYVPARAANPSEITVKSTNTCSAAIALRIDSTGKAYCSAQVLGKPGTSSISGAVLLYRNHSAGRTLINTWHVGTLTEILNFAKTYNLSIRGSYTLVLNVNVFKDGKPESILMNKNASY